MLKTSGPVPRSTRWGRGFVTSIGTVLALCYVVTVHAEPSGTGLEVTVPNGYANINVNDIQRQSTAGTVTIKRRWDGQEWKFNPEWESLSQSWKNLTGSQTADTTASSTTSSGGGSTLVQTAPAVSAESSCHVWVDEDWTPTVGTVLVGGVPAAGPMMAARTTPFNRLMGEASTDYPPPRRVNIDYATLCMGGFVNSSTTVRDAEAVRRNNELYLGDAGRYAFNNRSVLEKQPVQQLPNLAADAAYAALATGTVSVAPVTNDKGYRWLDKSGDWINYNTQGQVAAYGDKNGNTIWMLRDNDGVLRGIVDGNGHVVYSLHYTGELLTEVRDYPVADLDLPPRSVKYTYDENNRLIKVTDVRGYDTVYEYDAANRIVKITDQEGHTEQLKYNGSLVTQRIAPDGGVTDYVFEYDDVNKRFNSRITEPETSAGRRVTNWTHNRVGKLVRKVVNGRTDAEVSYDTGSRTETTTNARGFVTRMTRNEFDQVVEMVQPDGAVTKQRYSAVHLGLVEKTDALGVRMQYQYDSKGNVLTIIRAVDTPDQTVTDFEINPLGQTTKVTLRGRTESNGKVTPDAVWTFSYDAQGQLSGSVDPEGNTRQYTYDRAGNLVRYVDGRGNATQYEVDAAGNLTKVTNALGQTVRYSYDHVGNQTTKVNARAKTTQIAYDAMNRMVQTINAVGGKASVQYNGQGLPIAQTDEDGRASRTEFDNFLRVTKQIDGMGNVTEFSYDVPDGSANGALGSLTAPTEIRYPTYTKRARFDQAERPVNETTLNPSDTANVENMVETTTYDQLGRVLSKTDANGKTSYYAYDRLGLVIEMTDSLGAKTKSVYDSRGNMIELTDAKGHTNRFEYDRNDRVVAEIQPLGQTTRYTYDAAGNRTERLDPKGYKIAVGYDAANRPISIKQYKADGALSRTTTYDWDPTGNLAGWVDIEETALGPVQSSATSTFDDEDRKTGETITYPSGYSLSYGYRYSLAGKKTSLIWADGTELTYTYSPHGEFQSVTIPGEGNIDVSTFKWLEPSKLILPGGTTQERSLDGLLHLNELRVNTSAQQGILDVTNTWDKVQELKSTIRTDATASSSSTINTAFTYDSENRLTQAVTDTGGLFGTDTETFTLDAVGNRIAYSRVEGAWTYDANNRLLQRGTGVNAFTYEYDDSGNLTKVTSIDNTAVQYLYDTRNRLVEVNLGADKPIARYGYDPMGHRLWKEVYRDRSGQLLGQPTRVYYLYAAEGLIAEATQLITVDANGKVNDAGAPVIITQYGPLPDAPFTTGVLFAKTINSNGKQVFAYYHDNHLGAPLAATDKAGNLVWAATYDAYGKATITTPAATTDKPTIDSHLRLAGQIEDSETGLHYNYFRDYDPQTGRYLQSDPIGLEGGINSYVYVGGKPVTIADPLGLKIVVINDRNGSYSQARKYLDRDPGMKAIFEKLEKSSTTYRIRINSQDDDRFDEDTNTIYWDPNSANCLEDNNHKSTGGSQTPALGMGHEADHAANQPRGVTYEHRRAPYGTPEEQRVIEGSEAAAAKSLGEDVRHNHYGKTQRVGSPTQRPKTCGCQK
jgi:RHS repeat-associated protein